MSQAFQIGGEVAVGVVLLFLGGVAIYIVVSYALMRSHAAERTSGAWARELARESMLAVLTQPLLPLFYVVGRRMDRGGKTTGVPVVFVHGYMQNRVGFLGLARVLRDAGRGPLYGFNYPWFSTIAANAARLERFIESVCNETGAPKVDVICHSMGGLVGVEMMRDEAKKGALKVRRLVTIASPHAGVVWRGPLPGFGASSLRRGSKLLTDHAASKLPVPTLSIFSTHDNIVHPKQTSSLATRGGRDVEIEGPGHFAILFAPSVAKAVVEFLAEPDPGPRVAVAKVRLADLEEGAALEQEAEAEAQAEGNMTAE